MGSGFFRSLDVELVSVQREKKQTNRKQLRKKQKQTNRTTKKPKTKQSKAIYVKNLPKKPNLITDYFSCVLK